MKNKHITIGILGGIGPEATGRFYLKIISEMQKQNLIKSNADYPKVIINSIPAPELTYSKITEAKLKPYIIGVKDLEQYGANFIVMACNTIHLYHGLLQKEVNIPILNLKDAVKDFLINNGLKSVSIFGTPATLNDGLYQFDGISYHNPSGEDLGVLSSAIKDFNRGYKRKEQINKVKEMAKRYLEGNSEVIILGCTEISLMLAESKIPRIDTLDVLALATVRQFREMKKAA
ncbi:MAG: aspartate/glutamate racemase family protein [Candidatus Yanofskybacteria bacterium]|nr:aspartate/glutamate racemase family protein [Candidatus Yanofskybacteria bacterium]